MKLEPNAAQTVFALFYAIMWGAIANVWPRWRAFDWTLVRLPGEQALQRCLLSFALLNLCPIIFFIGTLLLLNDCKLQGCWLQIGWSLLVIMFQSFAVIGFYWLWMSAVQRFPTVFYPNDRSDERRTERYKGLTKDDWDSGFAIQNFKWGLVYILVPFLLLIATVI